MYGKFFESAYDGTLRMCWQAIAVFPHIITLANEDGVLDMTHMALHLRTGIPLDIIEEGIKFLESPDEHSRTPTEEGRRIERIDEHRNWGWYIVNHEKYRALASREEKLKADRDRIANKRKANKQAGVAKCRKVSQPVADVAYTDTDTKPPISPTGGWEVPDGINRDAWDQFEQHRREMKKPLTNLARGKAATILASLTPEQQQACVDRSIASRWAGLFPDRNGSPPRKSGELVI